MLGFFKLNTLCSARQPCEATRFAASPRVSREDRDARCWPRLPWLEAAWPASPRYQTGTPSPHSHRERITIPVQLLQPGNPLPTATSITHGGTSSVCPEPRQQLPCGQQSHQRWPRPPRPEPRRVGHGQGCGMGDFAPGAGQLRLRQRKTWGRQDNLPGHPHVPARTTTRPASPRAAQGHRIWGPAGISPLSHCGGHSAVTHAAAGDFCHGRAYAFRICLSFRPYSFI